MLVLACGCRDLRKDELKGAGAVFIYNPATGETVSGRMPPLIADLEHELMVAHENRLYHFGTGGYATPPREIMIYDPVLDEWQLRTRPRVDLAHFAPAPEGIYILSNIAELFIYYPDVNYAQPLGRIPQTPEFGAFPVAIHYVNNTLYVVSSGIGPELMVSKYRPGDAVWEPVTRRPLPGYSFFPEVDARAAEGGWYFLLYERSAADILSFANAGLFRYDFASGVIEARAAFPDGFEKCAFMADYGRDLFIFAEDRPEIEGAATLVAPYRYDEAADAWQKGTAFSVPGGCLRGAVSPQSAYLLGGYQAEHLMLLEYDFAAEKAEIVNENLGANFTNVFAHHDGYRVEYMVGKVVIIGMGFYR
jgi:hypothetical protein